jgi:hypothetical protein
VRPVWRAIILLAAAAGAAGCFKEEPVKVAGVALKVLPLTGGAKYVAVDTNGLVLMGTMRSGTNPAIHEDSARITKDQAAGFMHDASALGDTLLRRAPINVVEPTGGTVLAILFNDGSQSRIVWQTGHPHADARVNALADKLAARMPQ